MWSHREQLLKVARRRSMSAEDAEDAVHEAMLRAGENPNIDDERLAAWLTTVTMRLCVDRYRLVNREAEVSSRTTLAPPAPVPVDEEVCDRAEAKWLARRSRELPARQAEALWLKSEDLDVGQVASKMGLSYEAAESLLSRARRALRSSLSGTLALTIWLCGRGRPEAGGGTAQAATLVSTAVTLAALGIVMPYSHDGDRPRVPQATRAEVADDPVPDRDREEPAAPRGPTARPDSGATRMPGPGKPAGVTSLVPKLSVPTAPDVPAVPAVPAVPTAPSGPSAPSTPSTPSAPSGPSAAQPSTSTPTGDAEPVTPKDADERRSELPGDGVSSAEVRSHRD